MGPAYDPVVVSTHWSYASKSSSKTADCSNRCARAARKSTRPISVIPVAIKRCYTQDPTPSLLQTIEGLETRLFWRPQSDHPIAERILHVARGLLALKEMEHLRVTQAGSLSARVERLSASLLSSSESRYGRQGNQTLIPERVKEVRRAIIEARDNAGKSKHRANGRDAR